MKLTLWKKKDKPAKSDVEQSKKFFRKKDNNDDDTNRERKIRVLMVDDEEGFARLTKRNLEADGGFVVHTENRAKDAVPAAQTFRPDIILLDVMMPDGDGGEVAAKLSDLPDLKDVPIMFLTAAIKGSELGHKSGGFIGGRFYIAKPVSTDELVGYINQHVVMA